MKKLFTIILLTGFIACQNSNEKKDDVKVKTNPLLDINLDTVPKTTIAVLDTAFDFGSVKEGETVTREYRFVNTGNKPLIIQTARASCGCTVVDRPEKPIMPGDTASVKATFDSKGRAGETVHKQVFVYSNADPEFAAFVLRGKVEKSK